MKRATVVVPPLERLFKKVTLGKGCWEWKGARFSAGYGQMREGKSRSDLRGCHRMSFTLAYGTIPRGLHVLHKCDNKLCVRPSHLWLGTHRDNQEDMWRKKRQAKGTKIPQAKLTDKKVLAIRHLIKRGWSGIDLAKKYGVSTGNICLIIKRKTWKHLK